MLCVCASVCVCAFVLGWACVTTSEMRESLRNRSRQICVAISGTSVSCEFACLGCRTTSVFQKKKNITLTLFRVQLLNIESHFIKMSPPEATAAVERF